MSQARSQETVRFWRESAIQNMEVLKATYVTHAFGRHIHEGYAIGVIEAGVEAFAYRGSTYQAPAGSLVVIHPGEVHTGQAGVPDGWRYRMTYPPVSLMQQAAVELGQPATSVPFFAQPVIRDRALVRQFQAFHRALEAAETPLARQSQMLWLAAQLIDRYGEARSRLPDLGTAPETNSWPVRQVQAYLQAHYADSVRLETLSALVDLPPLRLLRLCRRELGLPPHRYLIRIRIQQAKRYLAAGMPSGAVAAATGFADQSHLNRHFKRWVGVTPGQYAAGCRT